MSYILFFFLFYCKQTNGPKHIYNIIEEKNTYTQRKNTKKPHDQSYK